MIKAESVSGTVELVKYSPTSEDADWVGSFDFYDQMMYVGASFGGYTY